MCDEGGAFVNGNGPRPRKQNKKKRSAKEAKGYRNRTGPREIIHDCPSNKKQCAGYCDAVDARLPRLPPPVVPLVVHHGVVPTLRLPPEHSLSDIGIGLVLHPRLQDTRVRKI